MDLGSRLLRSISLVGAAILVAAATEAGVRSFAGDALIELCASAWVVELWLAVGAWVCVLLVSVRPVDALGLSAGRLSLREIGLLALGTLAASHALDGALDLSGLSDDSVLGELPRLLEGARGPRLALALLALGVAPGIAEELLCRGLVQRGLARRFGPAVAIPAAALVFGALHVEPVHGGFAALLGLYLGLVAHWAGSTRPAMACHALNNLAAVLLSAGLGDPPWASGASVVGGGAVALGCLWAVGRRHPGRAGSGRDAPLPPGPAIPPP